MPRLHGDVILRALDANGDPVSGARLFVYFEGTSTPVDTFSDENLANIQSKPVIADSAGVFPPIYVQTGLYQISIQTPAGAEIPGSPIDDVSTVESPSGTLIRLAPQVEIINLSGDNATTDFTFITSATHDPDLGEVYISGVYQKASSYSLSQNLISFTAAPPSGSGNIEIRLYSTAEAEVQVSAMAGTRTRGITEKLGDVISVLDFADVTGDGVTDDKAALQAAIDEFRRTLSDSYVEGIVEVDFVGKTYAISGPLNIARHPYVRFKNGKLKAIGTWGANAYMLNCTGESALANMGLEVELALECEDKARGIYLQNCYRSRIDPRINAPATVGIYVAGACGLSVIKGIIHEREGGDSDFATDDRSTTGLWIGPSGGDITVLYNQIGWTNRCVYNEASGPVHFIGCHWYCSTTAPNAPILGTIYEHAAGADAVMTSMYLDSGAIVYRGGRLHIDGECRLFHLPGQTPSELDYYIEMIASTAGQSHLLSIDTPYFSDRAKRMVKKTEAGGNSWANVPAAWADASNAWAVSSRLDPVHESVAATGVSILRQVESDTIGALYEFRDTNTTDATGPSFGASGDRATIQAGGVAMIECDKDYVYMNMTKLVNAANDGDAATAGVPIGGLYRDGSDIRVRVA